MSALSMLGTIGAVILLQACCRTPGLPAAFEGALCVDDSANDASVPPPIDSGSDAGVSRKPPLVMLVVDTSGSMGTLPACTCQSVTDCSNCEPDCTRGQQNRWFTALAALTGSYENFTCQARSRTPASGVTYDQDSSAPNYVVVPPTTQRSDGEIDAFADRIQFGLATFDSEFTYSGALPLIPPDSFDYSLSAGVLGMFSYGGRTAAAPRLRADGSEVGRLFYPGCAEPYYVDSGIRSANASDGALSLPAFELSPAARSQQLRDQLQRARPYAGTPIAASLDDLYYFFATDPLVPAGEPRQERYVVLLTDGVGDSDFRELGCDCTSVETCYGEDPTRVSCPYPTAPRAARHLRCGFDENACAGLVDKVYVVGLSVAEDFDRSKLDELAAEGGSVQARFADDEATLRGSLRAVFEEVLAAE